MIKIFNFKDNYNLINNKFVNLLKNIKTSYLGFNNTKLGLNKNYFISNNRVNSFNFYLKKNGVKFFSTSFPINSSNSIRKGDVVSNLHSTLAFEKTLGVERYKFQSFPFHLVEQSPWPIVTSFTLFLMACSAVLFFHGFPFGGELLLLGFILTTGSVVLWFKDVILEGTYLGFHTSQVQAGLYLGFILFLVSEIMVFFSIFWAFLHSSLAPTIEINAWPPLGIQPLDPFSIPLLNTILLLSSGAFITWGHHALIKGDRRGAILGTFITILLAFIFTAFQGMEYHDSTFSIADSIYGTVFFASTGLHGIHVVVGTLFILVGLIRIINYHLTDSHMLGFESAILYWHMVDVVWIFLFIVVYYWGY